MERCVRFVYAASLVGGMSGLSDEMPASEDSSFTWQEVAILSAVGALVGIGGLAAFSILFWHPDHVRLTTPPQSDVHNFETKASWAMVILQGTWALLGIIIVAVAVPLTFHHLLRRHLGWPKITMVPPVLATIAATITVAIFLGA